LNRVIGSAVYFPREEIRNGRRYLWLWVLRPGGRISQVLAVESEEKLRQLRPRSRVRAYGHWRKRTTPRLRAEDAPWFLVARDVDVLWVPPPDPMADVVMRSGGAPSLSR
jgi:hypothetical protein